MMNFIAPVIIIVLMAALIYAANKQRKQDGYVDYDERQLLIRMREVAVSRNYRGRRNVCRCILEEARHSVCICQTEESLLFRMSAEDDITAAILAYFQILDDIIIQGRCFQYVVFIPQQETGADGVIPGFTPE